MTILMNEKRTFLMTKTKILKVNLIIVTACVNAKDRGDLTTRSTF